MGMSMNPRTLIAAIVIVASTTLAPIAHADGKNEIRAVTFDESAGTTSVHVRGADAPTFTVYKLERPTRVVIDMPQARLADAVRGHESSATFSPNTWAVSTIAAQQLDDNGVRVVVTMARPGRYDVKTVGNEVIVMVMPRDAAPRTANPEDLVRAQQQLSAAEAARATAQQQADAATATAKQMRSDAEAAKTAAADQVAKAEAAQHAVEQASAADLGAAKQAAAQAKKAADQAKRDAETAKATAANAQLEADRSRTTAEKAKLEALAEAQSAKADAAKAHDETKTAQAELAQAKNEAVRAQTTAEKKTARAELALAQARADAASERAVAEQARRDADEAKRDTSTAKAEASRARSEAMTAKQDAAADKKKAETARGDAEKMLKDAKAQVASLEKKSASAQELEDKARAASAAAQAREQAARDSEARAQQDRLAAETAVKQAKDAQTKVAASERTKAAADAKAAEDRLAIARLATAETESQRRTAEQAAKAAKSELDHTKTMLAGVEQQRTVAMTAAADAARARSEALAAADDASRRRDEAEQAASEASKKKKDAELAVSDAVKMKSEALEAARSAQAARDAADSQRKIAERAAQTAMNTKSSAELSINELTMKRQAAERAAAELETRSRAEARAQAEMAAAQTRKASDKDLADARTELAKLAIERKQAQAELADRRKAVSTQQAEAARLETVASQAKDAASREEQRRQSLAQKRTAEEAELASLTAAKTEAVRAAAARAAQAAQAARAAAAQIKAQVRVAEAEKPEPVVAKKPATLGRVSKVTSIDFKGDGGNGQVSIAVGDDAKIEVGEITATHAELIVDNAELAAKLERTLDVSRFGSPVKSVSSFRDRKEPNRVRLVAELAQPATPTIDRDAKTIRWHFISGESIAQRPVKMVNVPSPVVGGFGAASTPVAQQSVTQVPPQGNRRRIYHGAPVDFDFKDAPMSDLLRVISDTGHINIVVPQTIEAKVTVRLKHVPWDQALEVILQSYGLWYRREGIIYRIATQKELDAEDAAEAMRREAAQKAEVPRTEVITLNYASAEELKPKLEAMKSAHGTIEVDQRTNALIVNDVAGNRGEIVKLALSLDTQTPQISIEARIVEARSTFLRQIGIQWGGNAITGANGGNATGLSFPSSIAVTGANSDAATIGTGVASPSDFAVNLPAPTGSGEGGALGFALGSIGGNFNINLRLSALEDSGTVRIISAPKVTVLNNRQAKISQGVSIPISVVSAAGTNTQFVQADLSLTVTPYVSQRDCAIAMDLLVQKNEPDFVNTGARGDPTILRKEARTYMLVADGETTVLGGIYTRNSGVGYKKIPLLGDIPVLGWLFKNRRENDDRTEILVFITPKITNKGSLPCSK